MFRPLPMQHLELLLLREQLPHAALALAESGLFQPDAVAREELDDPPGEGFRHLYREARTRLDKILAHYGLDPGAPAGRRNGEPQVITVTALEELNGELGVRWAACSEWLEDLRQIEEERKQVEELFTALATFARLRVDLNQLRSAQLGGERRFLNLRIGAVPADNTRRLGEALGLARHMLQVFQIRERLAYVVIAGVRDPQHIVQVDSVLETAGFRTLEIPLAFTADGDADIASIRARLRSRKHDADAEYERLQAVLREDRAALAASLAEAGAALALARPWAELSPLVGARGGLALIHGWAPAEASETLRRDLARRLEGAWMLRPRAPRFDERDVTPVVMPRPAWLFGFTTLVRNFGVPRYGEIDPTAFFSLSFLLLFGMMFGDLGHGLVIAAAGLWRWHRRGPRFGVLPTLAGASAALFGLLYGSVFGYEHVFPAIWLAPMEDPLTLLQTAAGLGVVFIALGTALNIVNRLIDRDWQRALLAGNGLAGLAFYLAMVLTLVAAIDGALPSAPVLTAILGIPALAFLFGHWRLAEGGTGERLMVTAIEAFETIMGYVSGTLSFLRVAAFGLNHVALAIAVFAMAGMLGDLGHWLMVIGGNIFILVLEGAIVAIQVLRLEYYEGFSRFFAGTGRPFQPLTLHP